MRLAQESPAPGYEYLDTTKDGAGLYVGEDVLSDEDIVAVQIIHGDSSLVLGLEITEEAAAQSPRVTRDAVGKRIAVLIDSRLVSWPVIADGLAMMTHIQLGLDLPRSDREEIISAVSTRWPTADR